MDRKMTLGIAEVYCGKSGQKGFYNSQEAGLAKAMHQLGFSVIVFIPDKEIKNIKETQLEEGISMVSCPAKSAGVHAFYDWNVLLKYGIDVCEVPGDNAVSAPDLVKFCDTHGILAYNYIGTITSDTGNSLKKTFMNLLLRRNLQMMKTHQCFAKTESIKQELEKHQISQVILAPVGLDLSIIPDIHESKEQLRIKLGLPQKQKVLLFVGRMDEYKHPMDALEVLKQLSDEYSLVMIGTGELDERIDSLVQEYSLEKRVIRITKVENRRIHAYYKAVDYFLNFNPNEIFGMSILEAMYQNCNVLAIKAPGPSFIIEDRKNGFLCESVSAMTDLINHEEKISEGSARKRILQAFTWENTARIMCDWILAQQTEMEKKNEALS